uniref:Calcineurin-like phosphoesterase domain-containing protein n=1 Tax=Alexandrium monilatum TaxID=311494 RepID=A0A7S4W7D0_9DINO
MPGTMVRPPGFNVQQMAARPVAVHWRGSLEAAMLVLSLLVLPCLAASDRVVSVADLHGDFGHAVAILRAAGLIEEGSNESLQGPDGRPFVRYKGARWIGGSTTLVQTGDMVDRGTYARDLYALFADLRQQAAAAGGQVVNLFGNHDLMNLQGDLRYVSPEDEADFGGAAARRAAWAPTGWVGRQILEEFRAAFLAGDTLFVHAGLLPEHVEHGVDQLNEKFFKQLRVSLSGSWGANTELLKSTGPLWLRRFATGPEARICSQVAKALELAGAKRMVLGHTQVDNGVVRLRCGGHLVMADTIISQDGYPMCWQPGSLQAEGCQGSLSYVEVRDGEAVAVRLPPAGGAEGEALEVTPLPVKTPIGAGEL